LTSAIDRRLGTDELANIFGSLRPKDIMRARLNKKVKEAATQTTIVPVAEFLSIAGAMATMTTALPNFQQISLHDLRLSGTKNTAMAMIQLSSQLQKLPTSFHSTSKCSPTSESMKTLEVQCMEMNG